MKKIVVATGLIVVLIVLFYVGLHLFGRFIYNTQSCKQFNIDNIELRTGVDIPKVTTIKCECINNKKVSKFIIDTEKVDIVTYIANNDFVLVDDLYIKEHDNKNSTYRVVFNKQTAELIVNLTYKN
ncbi:hypothetical protein SAMN04515667_2718 [Formosa sp. Hel1_31_208]|uniref:hypothetical protein n=1 Tax=Formosa sp. Hel1_31_208 TaxID=1798225 RepID=UPI00087B0E82|nr:hypothetical protein [Formosa sp. Hel1_31_208]SDS67704.1 hypothetical protein SAMN04515667_2718 [Formosa sp. Hel1_31_208]